MHFLLHMVASAVSWLTGLAVAVSSAVGLESGSSSATAFMPAAVVVSSIVIAIASAMLAVLTRLRLLGYKRAARLGADRAGQAVLLREAVISAGRESVAVLNVNSIAPLSFAGGNARLNSCLRGPDATALAASLHMLLEAGIPFSCIAAAPDGRRFALRGCPVGAHVAVFAREEIPVAEAVRQSDAVLEALPFPVWIRGKDLRLRWANHAFLAVTNVPSFEEAARRDVALGGADRNLATVAQGGSDVIDARYYTNVAGQSRALAYSMRTLDNGEVAAVAVDVTDLNPTDTELNTRAQMEIDSMDLLSTGVAIFAHDRKLIHYNLAYARLWSLSQTWLDTHPTQDEILDRLREARLLPERRDFLSWKRDHLRLFEMTEGATEELWHTASGKSMRVEVRCLAPGGLVFVYDDVTGRILLERAYNTVVQVQKAMLDALHESVAVFGPDGRLKAFNSAFSRQWLFADDELAGEPHLNRLADMSAARIGRDEFWEVVRSGVASSEPERGNEWGMITRADGLPLSLALTRLPDGCTLLTVREVPGFNSAAPESVVQAAA